MAFNRSLAPSTAVFANEAIRRFAALNEESSSRPRFESPYTSKRPPFQEPITSPPSTCMTTTGSPPVELDDVKSPLEWLRQAQKGYVAKTKEDLIAELDSMNFNQLRMRAGPPPTVSGCDFYNPSHGEGNSGGDVCADFDEGFRMFKKGLCAPPEPLYHAEGMSDALTTANKNVKAYQRWYSEWGYRLTQVWKKENTIKNTKNIQKEKKVDTPLPVKKSNRILPEIPAEKSGW